MTGINRSAGGAGGGSMPIIVSGGDSVGSIKTARISGGTGGIQWARYNATTGAYVSDIAGQTGSTYQIAAGDIGFIVGAYLSSYQPFSHGSIPANSGGVIFAANSVTLFGDSLMQYGNPTVSGSAPASGGETSLSHVGWANDALRLTGAGVDATSLRAIGGTTAQQHITTQLPGTLADATAGAWYHGGVNSYNDALSTPLGGPYTQAQNIAAVTNIITQLAAGKSWVIIDSINPVSQAGITGAKGRASEFPAHNAAIKAVCDGFSNVIFNDEYAVIVDPASGAFNPLPNLIQTVDGIHDTTFGARGRGENVAPKITSRLSLTKYRTQGANLLPDFTGTGGTSTPGTGTINGIAALPANWNCTIASGSSTVTLSNPVAGTLRMTVSNPGGTASTIQLFALNNAALLAAIGNGDVVQGGADFATIGTSVNLTRIAASIRINGNTGTIWDAMARATANEAAGVFKYNQTASVGRRWTHPWTIPSVPTQVEFILAINVDPAGSAVVEFSLPTLFKLTP